jgi:hypothetical protein
MFDIVVLNFARFGHFLLAFVAVVVVIVVAVHRFVATLFGSYQAIGGFFIVYIRLHSVL